MDDNREGWPGANCGEDLRLKNSWWDSGAGKINVKTEILQRSSANDLGGGYTLSISGNTCKFSSSLVSNNDQDNNGKDSDGHARAVTGTALNCESTTKDIGINKSADTGDYIETEIAVIRCGDGICSSECGEDKSTCPADCKDCTSDSNCADKADCDIASHYWYIGPKQCSANACAANYKYCNGPTDTSSAANCAQQTCRTNATSNSMESFKYKFV